MILRSPFCNRFNSAAENHNECAVCFEPMRGRGVYGVCCSSSCARDKYL